MTAEFFWTEFRHSVPLPLRWQVILSQCRSSSKLTIKRKNIKYIPPKFIQLHGTVMESDSRLDLSIKLSSRLFLTEETVW